MTKEAKISSRNRGDETFMAKENCTVEILGLNVQLHSQSGLNEAIGRIVRAGGHAVVPNVNVQFANLANRLPWLCEFFNSAPLNFCDGAGIQMAARILGSCIPERINFVDWFDSLPAYCRSNGISFYFLGGRPGVAAAAAARITARFPGLVVAGSHHGYFDKNPQGHENTAVIAAINRCRPDILLVGFGMPLQEEWLLQNWDRVDARVALISGGSFDILSGRIPRPPSWLRRCNCEWLGRLFIEPRRLWKRYLVGNPLFLARVLRQRLGRVK